MDGHGYKSNQGVTGPDQSASPEEQGRQASSRSNCYGLLALVFRDPPSCQVVVQLRSGPLAEALRELGCDVARDLAGEVHAVTERLGEEYTRSFIGPGPHVSPYASVHRDNEGQLWGDSTVRAKNFIQATGLTFQKNWDSIPDHVAIELELMQRLTACEAELWARAAGPEDSGDENVSDQLGQCLEIEERFLQDHLCAWAPRFCDRVSTRSDCPFYGNMAALAKSIVISDVERIAIARRVSGLSLSGAPPQNE